MTRCCHGDTYVVPNGPSRADAKGRSKDSARFKYAGEPQESPSWAVLCSGCDKCLAVVDGPREEVYADL